jgi:hypothetical protein
MKLRERLGSRDCIERMRGDVLLRGCSGRLAARVRGDLGVRWHSRSDYRRSLEGKEMTRVKSTTQVGQKRSQKRALASLARATQPGGHRARGRRGEGLASARDRQRLLERNTAERERVERMIAGVEVPVERRAHGRESRVLEYIPDSLQPGHDGPGHRYAHGPRAMQPASCPVCGDGRIVTDEVMHGGTLRVSECLHCEHRWTRRPKGRWVELGTTMSRGGRSRVNQAL